MKEVRPLTPEETKIYNEYYQEYYEMIFEIAKIRVEDVNIAEVVAQETFVTAWERFDIFQSSKNPAGWLVLVAKNKSTQALRDRGRYFDRVIFGMNMDEIPVEDDYNQIEPLIPESEEKMLLRRFYEEGYTLQEMADERDVKLSAMKMRLKRAREQLKEKILQNF